MPRNGKMTEAELQTALVRCAREQGWLVHFAWKSVHSPKGWPDLVIARGRFLCVWELKNDTAKPTPEQIAWLDWWREFADFGERVEKLCCNPNDHLHVTLAATHARIHVALIRPDDLEAAYWLLMGQRPREDHPWPSEWEITKTERAA